MPEPQSRAAQILGERLKAVRLERGVSQETVAHLADMHVTNLGKIERGQANPRMSTVIRIAGVLDVDPGELIAGIGLAELPGVDRVNVRDLIDELKRRGK